MYSLFKFVIDCELSMNLPLNLTQNLHNLTRIVCRHHMFFHDVHCLASRTIISECIHQLTCILTAVQCPSVYQT